MYFSLILNESAHPDSTLVLFVFMCNPAKEDGHDEGLAGGKSP
jgi:hypothetical protein